LAENNASGLRAVAEYKYSFTESEQGVPAEQGRVTT